MVELAIPPHESVLPLDISDTGYVTGVLNHLGCREGSRAFVWDSTEGIRLLETLGGNIACGFAVSDNGIVYGVSSRVDGSLAAVSWSPDTGLTDLGTVPGMPLEMNASPEMVGDYSTSSADRYFYWNPETGARYLSSEVGWSSLSESGFVTGRCNLGYCLWQPRFTSDATLIPVPEGYDRFGLRDVNNLGAVVGDLVKETADGVFSWGPGFIWASEIGVIEIPLRPLLVDDRGHVIGWFDGIYDGRYYAWDPGGSITPIGEVPVEPTAVNGRGYVTGYERIPAPPDNPWRSVTSAFLWSSSTGMIRLGTLGDHEDYWSVGTDLNEQGWVIGYASTSPDPEGPGGDPLDSTIVSGFVWIPDS